MIASEKPAAFFAGLVGSKAARSVDVGRIARLSTFITPTKTQSDTAVHQVSRTGISGMRLVGLQNTCGSLWFARTVTGKFTSKQTRPPDFMAGGACLNNHKLFHGYNLCIFFLVTAAIVATRRQKSGCPAPPGPLLAYERIFTCRGAPCLARAWSSAGGRLKPFHLPWRACLAPAPYRPLLARENRASDHIVPRRRRPVNNIKKK
jgi:hypothetical protein